jgi:uncharacterized membrane protein
MLTSLSDRIFIVTRWALSLLATLALVTCQAAAADTPRFRLIVYQPPTIAKKLQPGFPRVFISCVTASGKAAGGAYLNDFEVVPVRWDASDKPAILMKPVGTLHIEIGGILENGQVVGAWNDLQSRRQQPLRWDAAGAYTPLEVPQGFDGAVAKDINVHGIAVGHQRGYDKGVILWDKNGKPTVLPLPPNAKGAEAAAINDHGEVVGSALIFDPPFDPTRSTTRPRPVRWAKDGRPEVLQVPHPVRDGLAHALSNNGRTAGRGMVTADWEALRWDPTGLPTLLAKPGGYRDEAIAISIDDDGTTYGYAHEPGRGPYRAIAWDPAGAFQYLDKLLDASGEGWRLIDVERTRGPHIIVRGKLGQSNEAQFLMLQQIK